MRKLGSYFQKPIDNSSAHQETLNSSFFDKVLMRASKGTEYLTHKTSSLFHKTKEHHLQPDNTVSLINPAQRSMLPEPLPPISSNETLTGAFPKNTSAHSRSSSSAGEAPRFIPIYLDEAPARSLVWLQEEPAERNSAPVRENHPHHPETSTPSEAAPPLPARKSKSRTAARRTVQKLLMLSQETDFFSAMPSPEQLATSPSLDGSFINAFEITSSPSQTSLPSETPSLTIDRPDLETPALPHYKTWPSDR